LDIYEFSGIDENDKKNQQLVKFELNF